MNRGHYKNLMPKLIFRNQIELSLLGWILAMRMNGIPIREAIDQYKEFFGYDEDSLPTDSAQQAFYRMTSETIEPKMREAIKNGNSNII